MIQILRATYKDGVRYQLEHWTVKQTGGPPRTNHYGIRDDQGVLYAWTEQDPALHEWDRMFSRALAQREAA